MKLNPEQEKFVTCQAGFTVKLTHASQGIVLASREPWVMDEETERVFGSTVINYILLIGETGDLDCPDCPQNGCQFPIPE